MLEPVDQGTRRVNTTKENPARRSGEPPHEGAPRDECVALALEVFRGAVVSRFVDQAQRALLATYPADARADIDGLEIVTIQIVGHRDGSETRPIGIVRTWTGGAIPMSKSESR